MITYIIQVNVALILFYGAYAWFLKHETGFRLSRFYLLSTLIVSLCIPVANLDMLSSLFINEDSTIIEYWLPEAVTRARPIQKVNDSTFSVWNIFGMIYFLGAAVSVMRIIIPLFQLRSFVVTAKMKQDDKGWYYLLNDQPGSFSFFNYVFLGSKSWYSEYDKRNILAHERAHVRCGHSVDVMLVQLMTVLVWFNPIIYCYMSTLEQLHEFEADQIASESKQGEYCELLVRETINTAQLSIANHFNKSLTLKRIAMINSLKQKMSGSRKLGLVITIALIVVLISCEEKVMTDIKKVAGQSVLLTEYPQPVLDALDKIKENYPNAQPKVYGIVRTEHLEDIDLKGKTATVIFADSDPNYKFYVILGVDEVNRASSKLFEVKDGEKVYSIVQEPASPVGGMPEFYKFIGENLKYPQQARRMGVEGRVFIKFMVDEKGELSDFQVIRGIGAGCDEEALRVMELATNWKPGVQDGMPVKSTFNLAIVFKLGQKTDGG